jgi:hypothetical protein
MTEEDLRTAFTKCPLLKSLLQKGKLEYVRKDTIICDDDTFVYSQTIQITTFKLIFVGEEDTEFRRNALYEMYSSGTYKAGYKYASDGRENSKSVFRSPLELEATLRGLCGTHVNEVLSTNSF